MLISTDCNYIYRSIVTEIDKSMLNLVNLSITSSKECNNCFLFLILVNEIKVREKKGEKDCESKTEVRGKMERFSEREREKKKKKRRYAPVHPGYFFILFPAVGI